MLRKLTIALLAIIMLPALAMAQPEAGQWEFTLVGSGTSDEDFVDNGFNFGFSVGNFVTKEILVSLRQDVNIFDQPGSDDDYSAATSIAADYHFDLGQWQPFIGAKIGYLWGDVVNDTWFAGPEAGLKWFVNNTTFIFGRVDYEFFFEDSDEIDDAFDDGRFVYSVGIGFLF